MPIAIKKISTYLPEMIVDNEEVNQYLLCGEKTTDEWMQQMTGIKTRHFSHGAETMHDMILQTEKGEAKPEAMILSSMSDLTRGRLADILNYHYRLPVFQINHGCAGFVFGLQEAERLIEKEKFKKVELINVEQMSRIVNWQDRNSAVLFGDACTRTRLEFCEEGEAGEILKIITEMNQDLNELLYVTYGKETENLFMNGQSLFKHAVQSMQSMLKKTCQAIGIEAHDLEAVFLHQANKRITDSVSKKLGIDLTKVPSNIDQCGNTSSCTIPLLIHQKIQEKDLSEGLWGISAVGAARQELGIQKGAAIVRSFNLSNYSLEAKFE